MAPVERSEEQPSEKPRPPIEIGITPDDPESAIFERTPDGGYTIFLRGEISLTIHPPAVHAAESLMQPETGGTVPFPDSSETGRSQSRLLHAEQAGANNAQAAHEPSESPVPNAEGQTGSLTPDSTSEPVTEPHSATEGTSSEESDNRKFELLGNPVRDPSFRERKSGKKIADFVLATHPEEEKTEYWRIRAFDQQAEKVRDQVRKGQTGVEATVYGPKQWKSRKKTQKGWEETEVTGYYAGFVKVPKKYRSQEQAGQQSQSQQQD